MNIVISNSDKAPIYEQIVNQIKMQILSGTLKEGDALPSMRFLAKELRISMITTKRAYEELEREGYIVSYVGKGSFVKASNNDFIREDIRLQVEEGLREVYNKAKSADISYEELCEILRAYYEEEYEQ
ncbi:MAG: GntR family transcriptional regulator [Lachnospiraceae bacterium]|nr:GntR family transcriptional regulator [Lachnospiraceae bacterium]